ncbi:uncharacterized protein V1477_005315 [Vespula maculifrons]|uniref:Uncharacterized protein n=1 Tax=Vespula maculifrons TaxID=7453 RepID=A0ABD2CPB0_VESMC
MEWFFSQNDCVYKPYRMYNDNSEIKGYCIPVGKTLPPCTPVVTAAARTKCVAVRIVISLLLLILIMAIVYRMSTRNLPNFNYRRRVPQNPRFDDALIDNLNQTLIPNSKLEQPDNANKPEETPDNLEEAVKTEEMDQ